MASCTSLQLSQLHVACPSRRREAAMPNPLQRVTVQGNILGAHHHQHSKAGSANLNEDVSQALEERYVPSDNGGKSDSRVQMAA